MLLFKKKFLPAIRAGEKTQTIRLWKHRRMRAGQRSYVPGAGHIVVEAVEPIALADLTDEDARRVSTRPSWPQGIRPTAYVSGLRQGKPPGS